jgi:NAD(P)-dependent dehydrogenase (short-subunit alcohol dehydrogenase family)
MAKRVKMKRNKKASVTGFAWSLLIPFSNPPPSEMPPPPDCSYSSSEPQHLQRNNSPYSRPMENFFDVEGLVVLITGGGTGIGLMMAKTLESAGAVVYIVGRRLDVIERAAKENSTYGRIIPLQGDITDREDLLRLADIVQSEWGYLNLLINNAGIVRNLYSHPLPTPASPGSISAFKEALWNTGSADGFSETFETNVTAAYYTTIAFLELLHAGNLEQKRLHGRSSHPMSSHHSSQVLTVSSSGAFRIDPHVLSPSYTLAKAATTHLGRMLANLLAPWGIRSNVLAPGVFPSEMTNQFLPGVSFDPSVLAQAVPLKRAGTEEDIAGTILYLASRAGAYVNGAVWLVDGGRVGSVASSYS